MTLLGFQPDPDFNRLRTALFCRQPDRVPLAELWIDAPVKEAILGRHIGNSFVDPDYDVEADIDFMYGAGYDYVHVEPRYSFPMKPGLEVPENAGTVLNWADFGDYQWPTIADVDFHWLDRAVQYLPSGMGIITGTSGIFEAAWRITGFTTFCLLMHDQPDLVAAIMQRVGALLLQIFERGAAYPRVGAMWISDDIAYASGPMLPPAFYRQHLFPWYRQMADICRQRDLPFLYHSDGLLWKVLPDLIAAGFNAIQPIEPKVMDIVELKRQVGDRLCLIGNIDLG